MHLLLPHASTQDPACRQALQDLRLTNLAQALSRLTPVACPTSADGPALPHEQVLARALGLPTQAPPWAAWQAHQQGLPGAATQGWAWVIPCHWQVAQAQVTLLDPAELALQPDESQALLDAMQAYFNEDGITLRLSSTGCWLACGDVFRALATASPEQAIGRDVAPWLPAHPLLRRLQNEMQMLLYTHPVNEARAQRGALTVNSFWLSGSGALAQLPAPSEAAPRMPLSLLVAACRQDWPGWAQAWQAIDAQDMAELLARLDRGESVRLTLCSEHRAQDWLSQPLSPWSRLLRRWRSPSPIATLDAL